MKTTRSKTWAAVAVTVLTAATVFRASADEQPVSSAPKSYKTYTGTVTSIDPKEHVLTVKDWAMLSKEFNLGGNCACSQIGESKATVNDLRSGEKVTVDYDQANGVLIASSVQQDAMQFEGTVKTIDNNKHTLVLHRTALDKELTLPADCKISLHEGKTGALSDIPIGSYVTATYEMPNNEPTARQIAQTSIVFTGTVAAIDLENKTIKASGAMGLKKFELADNCAIVIDGRADGKLSELKPNERVVLNYDEINGVNMVNRIAPMENQPDSVATYGPGTAPPLSGY